MYDKANILQATKLFVTRVKAANVEVTLSKVNDVWTIDLFMFVSRMFNETVRDTWLGGSVVSGCPRLKH